MGRRSIAVEKLTGEEILGRLRDRIAGFKMLPGVNHAQFEAQRHEVELVRLATEMAYAPDMPPGLRLDYIRFVLEIARGVPRPWLNKGETIDPTARGTVLETQGDELRAVEDATTLYGEMDQLVRARVPFSKWPDRIKGLAEAAVFREEELAGALADERPAEG